MIREIPPTNVDVSARSAITDPKPERKRKRKRTYPILAGGLILTAAVFHSFFLNSLGHALVNGEKPQRADIIVVLAGDYSGSRILRGAQLARDGYAPLVLITGGTNFYDTDEPHTAVEFAVRHGFPRGFFLPVHEPVDSTLTEVRALIPLLRQRGVHRFLLVTNAFHSGRSARIFRREAPDLECHPVIARDDSAQWWRRREGWKAFFFESLKTIADTFRI